MGEITDIVDDLRERLAASPFHSAFGLEVVDAESGSVTLSWQASENDLNLQGLIHGGPLSTLADTAMGLAVRTAIAPGQRHVTISMQVQFLRPGKPGRMRATGRVVRVGSTVAFAEAEVVDERERILVRSTGIYAVTLLADAEA